MATLLDSCPCRGCTDRVADPNCHGENGNCPHGYLEWKRQYDAEKKAMNKRMQSVYATEGYFIDSVRRKKK